MKKSKFSRLLPILLTVVLTTFSSVSNAKLYQFSRANCFPPLALNYGNESITFNSSEKRWSRVFSRHYQRRIQRHELDSGWQLVWNNNGAAHKDTTDQSLWWVIGYHYLKDHRGRVFLSKTTSVGDCNFSVPDM